MEVVKTKISNSHKKLQEIGREASKNALKTLKDRGVNAYELVEGKIQIIKDIENE